MTQPEINIGLIGHVDHGKTTLTKALTGKWTDTHSEEVKRGISIKLGYADAPFYKCPSCPDSEAYTTEKLCPNCGAETELQRKVSFVDAPGHETLMATMLSGAAIMDGALLIIAANETCPQPQTIEHLMALEIIGTKNIIIVQNKVDLVTEQEALENYRQIKKFVSGTCAADAPVIPISAHHKSNIDKVILAIEKYIPTPKREESDAPLMYIARSFDINKPGISPHGLQGGVLGGTLVKGKLNVGDEIEIRPGRRIEHSGRTEWKPVYTKIKGLFAGSEKIKELQPGGLAAISTFLDPYVTKSDSLTGSVIGHKGKVPEPVSEIRIKATILDRVVEKNAASTSKVLIQNEPLMLSVATATTVGVVKVEKGGISRLFLKLPVCAVPGQRIALSRRIGGRWTLIGFGIIQ